MPTKRKRKPSRRIQEVEAAKPPDLDPVPTSLPSAGKKINPKHLDQLHDLIMSGAQWYDICRHLCDLWGVTRRTLYNYRKILIDQGLEADREAGAATHEYRRALTREKIDAGMAKCYAANDMRGYAAFIKLSMRLDGLIGPQQVEHRFPEGVPAVTPDMTDEEIAAELEAARRLAERVRNVTAAATPTAPNVPSA